MIGMTWATFLVGTPIQNGKSLYENRVVVRFLGHGIGLRPMTIQFLILAIYLFLFCNLRLVSRVPRFSCGAFARARLWCAFWDFSVWLRCLLLFGLCARWLRVGVLQARLCCMLRVRGIGTTTGRASKCLS